MGRLRLSNGVILKASLPDYSKFIRIMVMKADDRF